MPAAPVAGAPIDPSKDETIIIVGDDGETYVLAKKDWMKDEFKQANTSVPALKGNGAVGIINQLVALGTYLAFIPPDFAEAIGACCTLVNLKAVLRNQVIARPTGPQNVQRSAAE